MWQEELFDLGKQAALWSKTQFLEAKQAGLFDHGLAFGKALISPVPIAKLKDSVVLQRVVCFAYENHEEAFTLGNSAAVWLETAGALLNLLFGVSGAWVTFQFVYSVLIAYIMYFLTLKSADPKHALVAFYLFLAYTLLSGWEAFTSLIFVLPALFIGAKTIVSMACCYYCYAIYKAKKDSVPYTAQHDEFESEAAA